MHRINEMNTAMDELEMLMAMLNIRVISIAYDDVAEQSQALCEM